jgi:uncharacterized RDD family membrane protein YckC
MSGGPNQPPGYPPGYNPGHPGEGESPYPQQPGHQSPYPQYPGQQSPYPQQQGQHQPYGYGEGEQPYYGGGYPPPSSLPTEAFGGFWIRLAAYIVDALILMIPGMVMLVAIYGFMGVSLGEQAFNMDGTVNPQAQLASMISNVSGFFIGWMYTVFFLMRYGATPGKLAMGLRVVNEDGMYLSFGRATGRYFAEILSGVLCLIGYIMIGFHQQKRGLHDLIAATYVVRKEYINPDQGPGF